MKHIRFRWPKATWTFIQILCGGRKKKMRLAAFLLLCIIIVGTIFSTIFAFVQEKANLFIFILWVASILVIIAFIILI